MKCSAPEKLGLRSAYIRKYVEKLESAKLITHDIIIARHGEIIYENYRKPFHKDFLHRMYSVTKSFVSLAIGFLEQDGLLDLDAPVSRYFPDELKNQKEKEWKLRLEGQLYDTGKKMNITPFEELKAYIDEQLNGVDF